MSNIVTVDFRNDTLFAVERDDGVFVAIKPICDTLAIDWKAQKNRIDRNPVLAKGRVMTTLPSVGGPQETVCLRLDLVNGWLFGIDAERVKPEARDLVIAYQEECYGVLFKHFYGGTEGRRDAAERPYIARANALREEPINVRRQVVAEARQTFGHQAGREVWFAAGMIITPSMYADPRQHDLFHYTAIKKDTV